MVIGGNGEIEDGEESKDQLRLALVGKLWTVRTFILCLDRRK